jgi:ACS family hexuronate transporter-like MFS transporter
VSGKSAWITIARGVGPVARWWVLILLLLSLAVNLIDRQVLSVLAPVIRDEMRLSSTEYSYIVFSFLLGMTLFQVPAGILLDRRGVRLGLPLLMLVWSAANALHATARSVPQFCFFRFLLGAGECGNYSAGIKVISRLFPPSERALAGGIFNSGTLLGAFLAPPLVVSIGLRFGWHEGFLLPSALGLLWIVPWVLFYRPPEEAPGRKAEPLRLLPLFRRRQVWGMVLMRLLGGPVIHFYWYWLPEYLKHERRFSMEMIGLLAGVPFFFAGLGNVAGGWFSGHLMRRGWTADRSRKLTFFLSCSMCLTSMLVPLVPGEWLAVALISLATFGESAYTAAYIGTITDLFSERVLASLSGAAGAGEGIVNMVLMLATGIVVDRFSYLPVFLAAGSMPMLGFLVLMLMVRRVELVA